MDHPEETAVCNINFRGVRQRRVAGMAAAAAAIAASIALILAHAAPLLRLIVFPMFFFAALCFLQAGAKTCVVLAMRDEQELGDGREPVRDAAAARVLRARSLRIGAGAFAAAALATAALWFVPT